MLRAAYTPQPNDFTPAAPPDALKARVTAILCALLALATAAVTSWFVIEGIKATEPASTARWAKVAAGVLLLVLELGAFGVAAQWLQHSRVLRALGWFVLALEITLMSLAQISIGTSAGKAAAAASGTVESRTQQADDYRKAAALREAEAATLRQSKHAWKRAQADQKTAEAAALTARAAAAVEARASEATSDTATSTPLVEIVGAWGLIGLSVALSLALSLGGIVMMHVAGSLWRRASGDVVPVEIQILRALHELQQRMDSGARPVVPRKVLEVKGDSAPALPAPQRNDDAAPRLALDNGGDDAHAQAPATPAAGAGDRLPTVAPTAAPQADPKPKTAQSMTLGKWSVTLPQNRTAAELAALAAIGATAPTHAAPSVQQQAAQPGAGAAEMRHPAVAEMRHQQGHQQPQEATQGAPEDLHLPGASDAAEMRQQGVAEMRQQEAEKQPRRARVLGDGRPDTGTDPTADGSRFNRVRKAIRAGKLAPSLRAIVKVEQCGEPTARRYLEALEKDGTLERRGRLWVLKASA